MKTIDVDIVIVGGGMVGASLAIMLPEHFNVLLVESFPLKAATEEPSYQPSYDSRATALAWRSVELFKAYNVWDILQKHVQPILDVHVSDRGYWGSTLLNHEKEQLPALGYVVENAWLGRSLLYAVSQKTNVNFLCPATVKSVKPQQGGAEVVVEHNEEAVSVKAKLAVIADGARSNICNSLGIHTHVDNYGHTAIVTNVSTSKPHNGIAYERFTETGPLALLPLVDEQADSHRSALIWTLPAADAEALLQADDDAFLKALQSKFGNRQGDFEKVGERVSYPLVLSVAQEQVRQHIVVLGNAAHSLHPVAGQGFNLALRDVYALANLLADVPVEAIGDLSHLQKYVEKQKADQDLTTVFSDVLPQLFSSKSFALSVGRGVGLVGLDLLPSMKSSFVKFATGIRN